MNALHRVFLTITSLAAASLFGCHIEGPAQGRASTDFQVEPDRVYFVDAELAREGRFGHSKVAVEQAGSRPTAAGTLEAYAVLRNRTDHPQQLEVQTSFYDSAMIPVEQQQGWQPVFLGAQSTTTVTALSTRPMGHASHFQMQVRAMR